MAQKKGFMHKKIDIRIKLGVSLIIGLCVFCIMLPPRPFSTFNNQLTNTIYQSESVSDLPITIVRMDEKTLKALGQPSEWSRQVYADLVEKLDGSENPPAVIVFDLLFTGYKYSIDDIIEAVKDGTLTADNTDDYKKTLSPGDAALASAAEKYGNVICGTNAYFSEHGNGKETLKSGKDLIHLEYITMPYDELDENVGNGLTNCDPDEYDYITKAYTGMWYDGKWYDSLSVSTLKKFKEYIDKNYEKGVLISSLTEAALDKNIKTLYRGAKTSMEENGANTLFLACGFLKWFEKDRKEPCYAPLILHQVHDEKKR